MSAGPAGGAAGGLVGRARARYLAGERAGAPAQGVLVMNELKIPVQGMTCGGCAASVERAVGRVPGVQGAKASFEQAQVVVQVGPGVAREALVQAIEAAGYDVPAQGA